jgi:hypothetical protein
MTRQWEEAFARLPTELQAALRADGYGTAEDLEECFQNEEQLEKYFRGLVLVRQAYVSEDVTEDTLSFCKPMGALRKLLKVTKAEVAKEEYNKEVQEVEDRERAKVQAKEGAKEAAKDNKKVAPGDKIRLEEALGQTCPGTAGLSGKEHSATGRKFLQLLIKERREKTYDIPAWEERFGLLLLIRYVVEVP